MDMFIVAGGRPLHGRVQVGGSKNATLPMMAAALAIDGDVRLRGIPQLADVETLSRLLRELGVDVGEVSHGEVCLSPQDRTPCVAHYDLVRRMRASICVLGPLVARRGRACVSLPGGCNIGYRPIDLHLKGLAALGAEISIERGYVVARAQRLRGAVIDLAGPAGSTVTGTCNVMTAACLARGRSTLLGAAREPEVIDLGNFLNSAGARISGLGTATIEIEGVNELTSTTYTVIPDRIEAATLMLAAAITGGELTLDRVEPEHLTAVIDVLCAVGVEVSVGEHTICAAGGKQVRPIELQAMPYPGFPTDVQAQFTALLSIVPGISRVQDAVFPDRFLHLPELGRMGARVLREGCTAVVEGVSRLSGASVMASDLRASAALLLAALAAEGDSVIRRIYHLDRGYERLELKLQQVGAQIQRVTDDQESEPASLVPPLADQGTPAPHFLQADRRVSTERDASIDA